MHDKVQKQTADENLEGNFIITDKPPTIISPLGAVPKPGSDKIRLIHDASRPENISLDSFSETETNRYQSMDDALSFVTPNCYMAKVGLASAYCSVRLHPDCYQATG